MQNIVLFAILLSISLGSVISEDCFDYGTDYYGFDMDDGHYNSQGSAKDCQIECQNTVGCEYWTWDPGKLLSLVMN